LYLPIKEKELRFYSKDPAILPEDNHQNKTNENERAIYYNHTVLSGPQFGTSPKNSML
jgi:hypothetical protein